MTAEDRTACVIVSAHVFSMAPETPFPHTTNDPERCTVWSNFEIADMNLWRGEAYTKYFDHLDASGGFYYEVSASTHRLDSSMAKAGFSSVGETQ